LIVSPNPEPRTLEPKHEALSVTKSQSLKTTRLGPGKGSAPGRGHGRWRQAAGRCAGRSGQGERL